MTILAGGWSAKHFDLTKLPGLVLAVNDSAIYAPRIDYVLSMDRTWTEKRFPLIQRFGVPVWLRRKNLVNVLTPIPAHVVPFDCPFDGKKGLTTLTDAAGELCGTHSGFCALNLAYQLRPTELYLVGFDCQRGPRREAHWFPQYPWVLGHATGAGTFEEWASQFQTAALQLHQAGIRTRLASLHSAVTVFERISRVDLEAACRN
jgi:hypothetical protein